MKIFPFRKLKPAPGSKMMSIGEMMIANSIPINPENPEQPTISKAGKLLNSGELVVAPTETRYALLARVDNPAAVSKLFEIKGRDISKPSAIFVASISELKQFAAVSPIVQKLAELFLPGPLTLVLKSKKDFGPFFTLNRMTGFRISSSPVITSILKQSGPLSATSANLSGQTEPDSVAGIFEQLGKGVGLYLDAGRLNNPGSTVVQLNEDKCEILRQGAIGSDEIMKAIAR